MSFCSFLPVTDLISQKESSLPSSILLLIHLESSVHYFDHQQDAAILPFILPSKKLRNVMVIPFPPSWCPLWWQISRNHLKSIIPDCSAVFLCQSWLIILLPSWQLLITASQVDHSQRLQAKERQKEQGYHAPERARIPCPWFQGKVTNALIGKVIICASLKNSILPDSSRIFRSFWSGSRIPAVCSVTARAMIHLAECHSRGPFFHRSLVSPFFTGRK